MTTARADRGREQVASLVDEWRALRAELRAIEEAEHPDVVDHHGRVWRWKNGDLYTHDDTLAFPLRFVTDGKAGLPSPSLADNPNYARLCATCRQNWPSTGKAA